MGREISTPVGREMSIPVEQESGLPGVPGGGVGAAGPGGADAVGRGVLGIVGAHGVGAIASPLNRIGGSQWGRIRGSLWVLVGTLGKRVLVSRGAGLRVPGECRALGVLGYWEAPGLGDPRPSQGCGTEAAAHGVTPRCALGTGMGVPHGDPPLCVG